MNWVAFRMLVGDVPKYLGMVFGVAFSTLLIAQQSSIFLGLVARASTPVIDVRDADLWVMDPRVLSVTGATPMPETDLFRVRGVDGVAWAAPMLVQTTSLKTDRGRLETVTLFGVDNASLVGLPQKVVAGDATALRAPGAIGMDRAGYRFLFGDRPFEPGITVEMNDTRGVLVALFDSGALFTSQVSVFARYASATDFAPGGRNRMSFIIGRAAPGQSPEAVARRITQATGLKALSRAEFARANSDYIIGNTGIPISFGTVVGLGIVVGIVVVALTFSLFVRDNLRQFGALKAIGVGNARLVGMVGLQGALVGAVGYGIGIGMAAFLIEGGARNAPALRGFRLPWEVAAFAAAVVTVIIVLAGLGALRRVLRTDPASVFR